MDLIVQNPCLRGYLSPANDQDVMIFQREESSIAN